MANDELVIMPLPSATLVFGLQWLPLLGGKVERVGSRLARHHRATHMVLAGDSAASVGIARLKGGRTQRKVGLYSAAQNVAQLFSAGTIALLLDLGQAGFWLVAVHEGAVIARTDRLFGSSADARLVLSELCQSYPQLVVLGDPQAPVSPGLGAIEAASSHHSRLRALRRWTPILPWPVQFFLLALVLVLLVPRALHGLRPNVRAPAQRQPDDPGLAWKAAVDKAIQGRIVHGLAGTRSLLDTLHLLPVRVGGWALKEAECTRQLHKWRCHARYDRSTAQASNSEFLAGAPAHWRVEFISIEQARPTWEAGSFGVPVSVAHLKTSSHNERELFSSLQSIRMAFNQMQIGQPSPLPLSVPSDEKGQMHPKPPGLTMYQSRSLRFSGPLRSASLMLPYAASIEWNKALLVVRDVDKPGLTNSGLSLSLQGVLYETETSVAHEFRPAIVPADHRVDQGEILY